jgi:hypothetical protein
MPGMLICFPRAPFESPIPFQQSDGAVLPSSTFDTRRSWSTFPSVSSEASCTTALTTGIYSAMELKDNTIIVVLGASGDLAKKKTVSPSNTRDSNRFD